MGAIDFILVRNGTLKVVGWTVGTEVTLISDGTSATAKPHIHRDDMPSATPDETVAGFELNLPLTAGPAFLSIRTGDAAGATHHHHFLLPAIPYWRRRVEQMRLLPGFLIRLTRALPAAIEWRRTRSMAAKARIKDHLGLASVEAPLRTVDAHDLFADIPGKPANAPPITIILPVYNAFNMVTEALDRVARNTDLDWHLVIVEDASTDPRVRPALREWCEVPDHADRTDLIENPENLGFIKSVNRAFDRALELSQHVVLLNSDAFVPRDWASRLLAPILDDPQVATVTPMSNDAEILSVPVICQPGPLDPGGVDAIDAVARTINPVAASADLPTGIGFCMAINIDHLRKCGPFDTAFGKGYGEEVDWCQRARALGGRHVGTGALFVEHRGGQSFGSEAKQALIRKNGTVISSRYRSYDEEVQTFIRTDPLAAPRLALAMALAGAHHGGPDKEPVPIYLAHSLGGGAEMYLAERIRGDVADGGFAVVLRVGAPTARWQIELHSTQGTTRAASADFDTALALLDPIRRRRIVYSCGVGHPDPAALPGHLLSLKRSPQDEVEVLFHDFFPLSPSYTLLNDAGTFEGVPTDDTADRAHIHRRRGAPPMDLGTWRLAWSPLIEAATDIVVFSRDSRTHVLSVWPDAADRIRIRPHGLREKITPAARSGPSDGPATIGILGHIGQNKGAGVIMSLARHLTESGIAHRLIVIGTVAPDVVLRDPVKVHGKYRVQDIPALAARYRIDAWLIPSIWPETFSYTTHEALATGLPVYCFDLGAQAEAVRAAPNGHVLTAGPDDPEGILSEIEAAHAPLPA